ncbi:MAG: hypothetical protein MdMp014T_0555 [Treponematales bacterium]
MDWHVRKSARARGSTGGEARHSPGRLAPLEPGSTAPKRKRRPEYTREPAEKVRAIRKEDRTCSRKKTRPVLPRDMPAADVPGIATPGRLIRRGNLFFRPGTKGHRKRPNAALKARELRRKP